MGQGREEINRAIGHKQAQIGAVRKGSTLCTASLRPSPGSVVGKDSSDLKHNNATFKWAHTMNSEIADLHLPRPRDLYSLAAVCSVMEKEGRRAAGKSRRGKWPTKAADRKA